MKLVIQKLVLCLIIVLITLECSTTETNAPPIKNSSLSISPAETALYATSGQTYKFTPSVTSKNTTVTFSLKNNIPPGMVINASSGTVSWTPNFQKATKTEFTIEAKSGNTISSQSFPLSVLIPKFVSVTGGGDGSLKSPSSLDQTLSNASPGDIIYLKSGTYAYTVPNRAIHIDISGTKDLPIVIKNYTDSKPKITFQGSIGINLAGNYLILDGIEVEGPSQSITYSKAIQHWWETATENANIYNGNGIVVKGHNNIIKDCIVHDTSGSGINISGSTLDNTSILDNIVYNTCWWSTSGGSAISCNYNPMNSSTATTETIRLNISGNFVFNSEQRLASHVFSKGFSDITIDEGNGILVQNSLDVKNTLNTGNTLNTILGKQLITHNLVMYCTKGIAMNKASNAVASNNTMYKCGVNLGGRNGGGMVGNTLLTCIWENNAVEVTGDLKAYSIIGESTYTSKNNFAVWPTYREDYDAINNVHIVSSLFQNASNLDFSNTQNVGISKEKLVVIKEKISRYNIRVLPTNYVVDMKRMVKDIINSKPSDPKTVGIKNPSSFYLLIAAEHLPDELKGNPNYDEKTHKYKVFK